MMAKRPTDDEILEQVHGQLANAKVEGNPDEALAIEIRAEHLLLGHFGIADGWDTYYAKYPDERPNAL